MRPLRFAPFHLTPLCLSLLVAACGDESQMVDAPVTPPAEQPPAVEEPVATPSNIAWETCSLETGGDDDRAECANVEVPLDWNQPDDKKVTVFVKRLLGKAAEPRQQLWLLQGGPGGAGDGLEPLADEVAARDDSVDVYIPDHRGTGRSAYLDCPATRKSGGFATFFTECAAEAEVKWGKDGLATFSTTTAARDVGYVIEQTRAKDQKVHVYGVSYGTYWAQRYLQLFPKQADAVTLDSICQSSICSLSKMGYWFDQVGKKYLGECGADTFCASKLGPDPVATVREAIAKADAGTCSGISGLDGGYLKRIYGWFIASFELRVLIPSTAYRIVRCNEDDVAALQKFQQALYEMSGGGGGTSVGGMKGSFAPQRDLSSDVLGIHIALSELEESPPPSKAELEALMADAVFGEADTTMRDAYDTWPRYSRDQWVDKYPETATPVLLMNGSLDPQTPQAFADQVAPHYTQPNQTYVVFPRAAHGVIHQSPTGPYPAEACGTTVWKQFIASPTAALDTSCTAKILPHDFESSPQIAQYFFGRPSLWSAASFASAPNAPAPLTPAASRSIKTELERAARAARVATLAQRVRTER